MPAPTLPPQETLQRQLAGLLRERLLETSEPVDEDTDLYALGFDSMAIMQLLILVEEEYGVALPEAALTRENFSTPRHLAQLIYAQAGAAS